MYKSFEHLTVTTSCQELKQEVQFDAHEFHLALVLRLMSKADAQ